MIKISFHFNGGCRAAAVLYNREIPIGLRISDIILSKLAIPEMLKNGGGAIINCASILGHVGHPSISAYAAAKGGVCEYDLCSSCNICK